MHISILSTVWDALPGPIQHHPALAFLFSTLAYLLILALYRLYLHPLASFRGPRWAAVTAYWTYSCEMSATTEGTFAELHEYYNTKALRIGPNELHITDLEATSEIYNQQGRFLKSDFYQAFPGINSLFAETNFRRHREIRRNMNPIFSKMNTVKMEPLVREKLEVFLEKVERISSECSPVQTSSAFRCLTADIIGAFAFGYSMNLITESTDTFQAPFFDFFDSTGLIIHTFHRFPITSALIHWLPNWLMAALWTKGGAMQQTVKFASNSVKSFVDSRASGTYKPPPHPVFYEEAIDKLPMHVLAHEAIDILVAGTDTTAITLSTGLWKLVSNPATHARLRDELDAAIPNAAQIPPATDLEKLPYLHACVKEMLRTALPAPVRLPRVVPTDAPLVVEGKRVPAGAVVGMSATALHHDPAAWGHDAHAFRPERWLDGNEAELERRFTAFGKGNRSCIGIHLAYSEIYIILATIVRRYEVVPDPTVTEKDLKLVDTFVMTHPNGGPRISLKRRE